MIASPQALDDIVAKLKAINVGGIALGGASGSSVALIGADDEGWSALATPSVTVVRQPVDDIGAQAARLLMARIEGSTTPPQRIVLQPTLIMRQSTAHNRSIGRGRNAV